MWIAIKALLLALFMLAWAIYPAYATDWGECEHPRFQEVGCTYPGEQGPPGQDGEDGRDGHDGRDGVDGEDGDSAYQVAVNNGFEGNEEEWLLSLQGRDGIDGIDGKDGVVPTEWITETRYRYETLRDNAAAMAAMETHLPQYSNQRLHFNAAHVEGRTGIGFGYAYMLDNERNAGLTFAMGHSGSETVARASFGFEFGGDRPMRVDMSHIAPAPAPEPVAYEPPAGQVVLDENEYEALLIAQVQQEELDDQRELAETRYAQQQNLIESLQEEIEDHELEEAELERLKQEAARLSAAQEAEEREREALRNAARQRLLMRSQGNDEENPDG